MATKLYVGNLPYNIESEQLTERFSSFGDVVSANVITDKFSGRSKGFGFVEFASDSDAQKAIAELNGAELNGRKIVVNEARPPKAR